ncbi:ComF family protein [Candidatus Uhrbacteria bacterium]|nr:ComF family protein [Candidatus Uhrbacteria bacterium]
MEIRMFRWLVDAIFPKQCLRCGREGMWACEECQTAILPYILRGCVICKKESEGMFCGDCARNTPVSFLFSAYSYMDPFARKMVHALKYEYVADVGAVMGVLLARAYVSCRRETATHARVVPIPIHKKRFRDRGFNQSELIARAYARELQMPIVAGALERVVNTQSQVELSGFDRMKNIAGAFAVHDKENIQGSIIYLIDDVYTTGATLIEAARTLKNAGAQDVIGLTFAREE